MQQLLAMILLVWACDLGAAAVNTEVGEAATTYTDAALDPVWASEDEVDAQIEVFLASEHGRALEAKGAWIGRAKSAVAKSMNAAEWGKLREAAYRTAWSNVQTEFIRYQYDDDFSEVTRRFFSDASNAAPEYVQDEYTGNQAIDEFIDKAGAVLSSKLDGALRDLDVDPEAFARGSNKQRKEILSDSIRRETIARSIGKLGGLWPVKTFTSINDGFQVIGVVGVYRPEFQELAGEIAGRRQILSNGASARPLAERISTDPAQLVDTYGIRVLRDESGYPVLVAFGQYGVSGRDLNPVIMSKLRQAAIAQARSAADTELLQFINGTSNYTDKIVAKAAVVKYVDVDRQGYVESGDEVPVTDIVEQILTTKAHAQLSGLRDFKTWTYRHPDSGNILVGVVRLWSPVEAEKAKAIASGRVSIGRDGRDNVGLPAETVQPRNSKYQGESPDLGDPEDF